MNSAFAGFFLFVGVFQERGEDRRDRATTYTTRKTPLKWPRERIDLLNAIQEVVGSIPSGSTFEIPARDYNCGLYFLGKSGNQDVGI